MSNSSSINFLIVLLASVLFTFTSCSESETPANLNGDKADIMSMLRSQDITQRASIPSDNFNFVSESGTTVTAEPNSFIFNDDGGTATGMIDFEMIELFTKSEILQYGIETKSNNSILESDGEFFFSASQNGRSLRLANGSALALSVPTSNPNSDMELFIEGEGAWWPTGDSLNVFVSNDQTTFSKYEFFVNRLDWVNIDYFTKFDLELTDISICLPEVYKDNNIALWIVFRDIDVVLSSSGNNLPIGEVISIVCIAAENEDVFRIDIQEVTVEEGLKVDLDPQLESTEDIKSLLKALD